MADSKGMVDEVLAELIATSTTRNPGLRDLLRRQLAESLPECKREQVDDLLSTASAVGTAMRC